MHIFRQSCSQSCCFSSLTDRHNCSQTWLYLFCFPTNQQCVFSHFLSHTHQGENKEDKPLPINPNEQLFIALRLQTFLSMFSQSKLYHFTNCTLVSADMLLFFSLVCIHLCTCFMRKEIVCVLCGHQAWKRIMGTTPKQKNACLVRMATKIPSLDPYPSKLDVQHKSLSKPKLRGPAVV